MAITGGVADLYHEHKLAYAAGRQYGLTAHFAICIKRGRSKPMAFHIRFILYGFETSSSSILSASFSCPLSPLSAGDDEPWSFFDRAIASSYVKISSSCL